MTQWTRLQELEDFRIALEKLELFLSGRGPKAVVNIIDPEQIMRGKLDDGVQESIAWVKSEIESEEEKENDALPSEGRRTRALVGE
jgi:hypothetical protein